MSDTSTTSIGARSYADIIERGRKPPVNYPGRFPAKLAIEAAEPEINRILGDRATRVIKIIESR